jgi:hypothetical protein
MILDGEIPRGIKHVLSKELEIYYSKITEILTAYGKSDTTTIQMVNFSFSDYFSLHLI